MFQSLQNKMGSALKNLQQRPYHVRVRILWSTVLVVAVLLLIVWVQNLKSNVNKMDNSNMLGVDVGEVLQEVSESQQKNISIEWLEQQNNLLLVYFKVNNPTDDIMNFSKLEDIKLEVKGNIEQPTKITDRQGNAFVQRVLSHTQNFGILTFVTTGADGETLVFDQMNFEQSSDKIFKESFVLDYAVLTNTPELRN
jgi:hypothetical protein